MATITGPTLMKQFSLEPSMVRKNTETGEDLRERDLGGYEEAKVEVIEYVNFVNHQERYRQLGARLPKGALLAGPPGTGKTLLARATAGEANIPFISCSTASLLLGTDGPAKLRKIFQLGYSMAPCVMFFDEIDAIALDRDDEQSKPETQCITEELLVQLDGFHQREDKLLIVLASTNRSCNLDKALLRPGRFDRIIEMPKPDLPSRVAILQVHLKPLTTSIDKGHLAKRFGILTSGFTGAQIQALCNEAAMIAARDLNEEIGMQHFESALDRVRSGIKKRKPLGPEAKLRAARHDAAHAVAGWHLEGGSPPTKLCVMPDTSGDVSCSQDRPCGLPALDKEKALNFIAVIMAGAAAEQIFYGEYFTNCGKDFESATKLMLELVSQCCLTKNVGIVSLKESYLQWGGHDARYFRLSSETFDLVFEEIRTLLDDAFARAIKVLKEYRDQVDKVAQILVDKDLVTLDMLHEVLGESPYIDMEKLSLEDADFLPSGMKSWNKSDDD